MHRIHRIVQVLFAVAALGFLTVGAAQAGVTRADVVRPADIQASIDQKVDTEAAQRDAVHELLHRADVRRIAGAAGLNVERADAAAAQLSGADLADASARANAINALTGGRQTVTIGVTTLIIILLLILLLR